MMNRLFLKLCSQITAALFIFSTAPTFVVMARAEDTVILSSAEDFKRFAQDCVLDSRYTGKTVSLTQDIDLSGVEISPIPTFGGTFLGNGKTVSGVSVTSAGSYMGLFRYLQKDAAIKDLHVSGAVTPAGTADFAGGIVGRNSGTIQGCSFDGTVLGNSNIGGIAGINSESGRILSCTASGEMSGKSFAGGITGKNLGSILNCENRSGVNTSHRDDENDTKTDIDPNISSTIEDIEMSKDEKDDDDSNSSKIEEKLLPSHSDIGGITGYTSGIVQGSQNRGTIGCKHMGYNIGGIAGRQAGYMLGCENYGKIYGRKDVGGIAGQSEPYIILNPEGTPLSSIKDELDKLHNMTDKFISDTDSSMTDISNRLKEISVYTDSARTDAEELVNLTEDFVDDNFDKVNAETAIISDATKRLVPVFDELEGACDEMSDALGKIKDAFDVIDVTLPDLDEPIDDIQYALDKLMDVSSATSAAAIRAKKAANRLSDAFIINNESDVRNAFNDLSDSLGTISASKKTTEESLEAIIGVLKSGSLDTILGNRDALVQALTTILSGIKGSFDAVSAIGSAVSLIIQNTEINYKSLQKGIDSIEAAMEDLFYAMDAMADALDALSVSIDDIYPKIKDFAKDLSDQINDAVDKLSGGVDILTDAVNGLTSGISDARDILSDFAEDKPLTFVKLGDDYREVSERLFGSISGISDEISVMRTETADNKASMTNDLRMINSQFNIIMNMITSRFDENDSDADDDSWFDKLIVDASDEDINATKQGKVEKCKNYADIEADRNVGGISGAMAIEYSTDPEDEFENPNTLNFTYRTKAVLQKCVNEGKIIGQKDCIGGIVGRHSLGTVYECEGYGDVSAEGGSYIGGIAGRSEFSIRKSYGKCTVSGKQYVGGIAGRAGSVSGSYAISQVTAEEGMGAIAGKSGNIGSLRDNYYVNNGVGAVDSISYSGKAEPISYAELSKINGLPRRFIDFTVTYIADGNVIDRVPAEYGRPLSRVVPPEVPAKVGCFGVWQEPENENVERDITIEAVYRPYITILESAESNDSGRLAIGIAEGEFTDKAVMHVTDSSVEPPVTPKAGSEVKTWDIRLESTQLSDTDKVPIRLLNENRKKATVWMNEDGAWKKLDSSERGKYIMLEMTGRSETICVLYEPTSRIVWIIVIIGALCVLLILAAIKLIGCCKKRRKAAQPIKFEGLEEAPVPETENLKFGYKKSE